VLDNTVSVKYRILFENVCYDDVVSSIFIVMAGLAGVTMSYGYTAQQ